MKKKNMEKPYDGKKSAWVPDKSTGGYLEGLCENDMKVADWEAVGKKVNVVVNGKSSLILIQLLFKSPGETKTYKSDAICQVLQRSLFINIKRLVPFKIYTCPIQPKLIETENCLGVPRVLEGL